MSGHPDKKQEKSTVDAFMQYVQTQELLVHPSVRPYHFYGHGMGMCAAGVVEVCNGQLSIHR